MRSTLLSKTVKSLACLLGACILICLWVQPASAQKFFFPSNVAIPDNNCASGGIDVSVEVKGIGELNYANQKGLGFVFLTLDHTYVGDITITLTSPEGTTVVLTDRNGGGGEDYTNTHFTSWTSSQSITSATAPFTGFFNPEGSLWDFNGEWADGIWTLNICDAYTNDVGTLIQSGLRFNVTNLDELKFIAVDFDQQSNANLGYGGGTLNTSAANATTDMHGQADNAYNFTGTNPLFFSSDNADFNPTDGVSMAAWVKPSNVNGISGIIGKSDANYQNLYLLDVQGGEYRAQVKINGTLYQVRGGTATSNRWSHVAVSYQTGGSMILYVDGVEVDRVSAHSTPMTDLTGEGNWRVGCAPWSSITYLFSGTMDDLGVWSYAISEWAVRDHASAFNNHCRSALELPVAGTSCTDLRYGETFYGFDSDVPSPICGNYWGGDQWFSVVVPASGRITVETKSRPGQTSLSQTGLAVYSGDCDNLQFITCTIVGGSGSHSKNVLNNRTPGETLYYRVYTDYNSDKGFFGICAYSTPLVALDEPADASLNVYPNPTQNMVNVQTSGLSGDEILRVYDLSGRILVEQALQTSSIRLDLSEYPAGIYLLEIKGEDKVLREKIIRN